MESMGRPYLERGERKRSTQAETIKSATLIAIILTRLSYNKLPTYYTLLANSLEDGKNIIFLENSKAGMRDLDRPPCMLFLTVLWAVP
jgi:hypothetical protein